MIALIPLTIGLYALGCLIWLCVPIREKQSLTRGGKIRTRYIPSQEMVCDEDN